MRKHIIPLLILCIAALSSCDDSFRIQTVNSEAYIITVGIDYANTEISDLDGTVNDALEMAACLSEIYRQKGITPHVTRMIQEGEMSGELDRNYPSRDGILSAIEAVPAGPDDIIVFFYSGHGDILPDGRTILAAARTVKDGPYGELLSEDVFNALNAKGCPVLAIIDACNSGRQSPNDVGTGETYVEAPLNYYPYYHVTDENGNELATDITELLRLRITLPEASSGTVTIHFEIPAIWRVGDIISLLTLAGLAALAVLSCRKRKEA